jgi:amino acid transporter
VFAALYRSRLILLLAFAFSVMGDPVSSVAYAIEAALRALDGDLTLLLPAIGIVIGIILLVSVNYHQLYARFPEGGGDAAATGQAFGEGLAFLPLGALIVDYALTIAISSAAGASAIIAYYPSLGSLRIPLLLGLLLIVSGLMLLGHGGRSLFALMTITFVVLATAVIVLAFVAPDHMGTGDATGGDASHPATILVLLAFPVAMALATGVEAPSSAIAQLGQLNDAGRRRFGRITLWLMLAIVVWLSIGLAAAAVHLDVGIPGEDSTQIADIADAAAGDGFLFAAFQLATGALLLAAASSSFQAGSGLLKALARGGGGAGVLPAPLARTNRHHTPYWGVAVFLVVSAAAAFAAGGEEQNLVLFYAVAVFLAFLAGLLAMMRFFRRERRWLLFATSAAGAVAVAVTLLINLARGYPLVSLAAALTIAAVLHRLWVRAGRPTGVSEAEAAAAEDEQFEL